MAAGLSRLVYDAALNHPAPGHSQHSGAGFILRKGENVYGQDLGIHLHVVAEKDGQLMDPGMIQGKTVNEIKQLLD